MSEITTSALLTLLAAIVDPYDCAGELVLHMRHNLPGTDIFVDLPDAVIPVKTTSDNEKYFGKLPPRVQWLTEQLDSAGFYVESGADIVAHGHDSFTVFLLRH